MNSSPSRLSTPLVVFLIVVTLAGLLAVARPDVVHRLTVEAYNRDPWRRIKPLAQWHQSKAQLWRIRLSGVALVAIVVWIAILVAQNQ